MTWTGVWRDMRCRVSCPTRARSPFGLRPAPSRAPPRGKSECCWWTRVDVRVIESPPPRTTNGVRRGRAESGRNRDDSVRPRRRFDSAHISGALRRQTSASDVGASNAPVLTTPCVATDRGGRRDAVQDDALSTRIAKRRSLGSPTMPNALRQLGSPRRRFDSAHISRGPRHSTPTGATRVLLEPHAATAKVIVLEPCPPRRTSRPWGTDNARRAPRAAHISAGLIPRTFRRRVALDVGHRVSTRSRRRADTCSNQESVAHRSAEPLLAVRDALVPAHGTAIVSACPNWRR